MSTTRYEIEANLALNGADDFKKKADEASLATKRLKEAWGGLKSVGSGFDTLASHATSMASAMLSAASAVTAVGSAIGLKLAHSVGTGMQELEDKSTQLATIVAAAAEAPFDQARRASSALFDQFRVDAIKSAGATSDYVDVASKISGAVFGAGKGMTELHDMTASVIATAQSFGTTFEQAGSDMMRMLQGGAGSEQPLFRAMVGIPSLGIQKAEEFNKLTSAERYEKLSKALNHPAFLASIEATSDSMTGLLSTAEDVASTIGSTIGGQLYGLVKDGLKWLTDSANRLLEDPTFLGRLSRIGGEAELAFRRIGDRLGTIFPSFDQGANGALDLLTDLSVQGLGKLEEGSKWIVAHWSEIKQFASDTKDTFVALVKQAKSFVETLGGGDFATGAKRIAGAIVATKGIGAAHGLVSPFISGGYDMGKVLLEGTSLGNGARESIAKAGQDAARAAAEAVEAAAKAAGKSQVETAKAVAEASQNASSAAIKAAREGLPMLTGGIGALGVAAAAAAAGIGLAVWQISDLIEGLDKDKQQNLDSVKARIQHSVDEGDAEGVEHMRPLYVKYYKERFGNEFDGAANSHIDTFVDTARNSRVINDTQNAATAYWNSRASSTETPTDQLVDIYNMATERQDIAMAELAAHTIVMSGQTAASLEQGGLKLAGGIGVFEQHFSGATDDLLEMFKRFQYLKPSVDLKGKGSKTPSSSGMTITLKWDLGDGNEEAIYARSRRDIIDMTRRATAQARGARIPGQY